MRNLVESIDVRFQKLRVCAQGAQVRGKADPEAKGERLA